MIGEGNCPFCARIERGEFDGRWGNAVWFEPLNPVTPGHLLFVPITHSNPKDFPFVVTNAITAFDQWHLMSENEDFNLILNAGETASQTIEHTHLHYVPRRRNDGLILPWTNQTKV
jgi:histidine triad (HIT) family protein